MVCARARHFCVVGGRKVFAPRTLLTSIAALFLPLLFYLYIPLRGDSDVGVEYHGKGFADIFFSRRSSRPYDPPSMRTGMLSYRYPPEAESYSFGNMLNARLLFTLDRSTSELLRTR